MEGRGEHLDKVTINKRLRKMLHFSAQDLASNREGNMSQTQYIYLHRLWVSRSRAFLLVIGFCLVMGLISWMTYTGPRQWFAVGLFGLVALGLFYLWLGQRNDFHADLRSQVVRSVKGKARLTVTRGRTRHYCTLEIGDKSFDFLQTGQDEMFIDGVTYRIYYTPLTEIILSAESIDDRITYTNEYDSNKTHLFN